MKRYLIIDCYVDEPACLGVPPFLSPYPRLIAGALVDAGVNETEIDYSTIDNLRETDYRITNRYAEVFLIGGAVVPGRYLGARIGSFAEIKKIIESNEQHILIGGLISHLPAFDDVSGNFICIKHDIEYAAYHSPMDSAVDGIRSEDNSNTWPLKGAFIAKRHHDFPYLIAEIETYRGCPREKRCSFCSENIFSQISFRSEENIIAEVDSLVSLGISRFRLGRQADILCYGSALNDFRNGFPRPDAARVEQLFQPLKERRESGKIILLSIDNANPGTIANFPEESEEILKIIADAVTEGETMALGAESFDPALKEINSLKADKEQIFFAVEMINRIGGTRRNGIPVLLPGINLIHGLTGETAETFRINYATLTEMADKGLMLKRINIRKIQPFPGTPLYERGVKINRQTENRYDYYKKKIREDIDPLMLQRIYPAGTILNDLRVEEIFTGYSYARQLASYPIICKIPGELPLKSFVNCVVTGHRERSLTALPLPIEINTLPQKSMEFIPGIGKLASKIILARPVNREQLLSIAPSVNRDIERHFIYR